jgi:hypothetical protein
MLAKFKEERDSKRSAAPASAPPMGPPNGAPPGGPPRTGGDHRSSRDDYRDRDRDRGYDRHSSSRHEYVSSAFSEPNAILSGSLAIDVETALGPLDAGGTEPRCEAGAGWFDAVIMGLHALTAAVALRGVQMESIKPLAVVDQVLVRRFDCKYGSFHPASDHDLPYVASSLRPMASCADFLRFPSAPQQPSAEVHRCVVSPFICTVHMAWSVCFSTSQQVCIHAGVLLTLHT